MITSISIGNFKAFAESQKIPIRPLTLIFGANSSGKSSILHSLIFARHASDTGELDVQFTEVGGNAVDLGGFRQFIHGRNTDLKVEIEWEIECSGLPKRLRELLPMVKKLALGLTIGLTFNKKLTIDEIGKYAPRQLLKALIEVVKEGGDQSTLKELEDNLDESEDKLTFEEIARLQSTLQVEGSWLYIDNKKLITMSLRPDGFLQTDTLDRDHEASIFLLENIILAYSTSERVDPEEIEALGKAIDDVVPNISFEVGRLFPEKLEEDDQSKKSVQKSTFVTVRKETRLEDLEKVIQFYLPSILEEIIAGISDSIRNELGKIKYLGPMRIYPPRHLGFSESHDSNWVSGGGPAWDTIRKNPIIRQKVNEWLGDGKKLSTHYELRLRHLLTIESIKNEFSKLAERTVSRAYEAAEDEYGDHMISDFYEEVEEKVNEIPEVLEKLEPLLSDIQELVLFDKRSRTTVSHRDVGIGISQVLPVLVNCYALKQKIIAMEQPEIHLHPALQAELGDVFIESALGERKNTLIIESHSEHVLLRIMRRMRETNAGKLPEGCLPVRPEDVMVLFVEPDGSRSIVREMPLNENGELVKAWPGGFFEEGLRELF